MCECKCVPPSSVFDTDIEPLDGGTPTPCGDCCIYSDENGKAGLTQSNPTRLPLPDGNFLDYLTPLIPGGAGNGGGSGANPDTGTCTLKAFLVSQTPSGNVVVVTLGVLSNVGPVEYSLDRRSYQRSATFSIPATQRQATFFVRETTLRESRKQLCEAPITVTLVAPQPGSGVGSGAGSGSGTGAGSGTGTGSAGSGTGTGSSATPECQINGLTAKFLTPIPEGVGLAFTFVASAVSSILIELFRVDTGAVVLTGNYDAAWTGPHASQIFWENPVARTVPLAFQIRPMPRTACSLRQDFPNGWGAGQDQLAPPTLTCAFDSITFVGGPNTVRSFLIPLNTFSGEKLTFSLFNDQTGEDLTDGPLIGKPSLKNFQADPADPDSERRGVIHFNDVPAPQVLSLRLRASNAAGYADMPLTVTVQLAVPPARVRFYTTRIDAQVDAFRAILSSSQPASVVLTPKSECLGSTPVSGASTNEGGTNSILLPSLREGIYDATVTIGNDSFVSTISLPSFIPLETLFTGPGGGAGGLNGSRVVLELCEFEETVLPPDYQIITLTGDQIQFGVPLPHLLENSNAKVTYSSQPSLVYEPSGPGHVVITKPEGLGEFFNLTFKIEQNVVPQPAS